MRPDAYTNTTRHAVSLAYTARCLWSALCLGLGISPAVVLALSMPALPPWACLIMPAGWVFGLFGALIPARWRLLCSVAGVLSSIASGVVGTFYGTASCLLLAALGALCALVLPVCRDDGLPPALSLGLAVMHALMPVLIRLAGVSGEVALFPLSCAYLAVFLLNVNAFSLRAQCASHAQRPARSMRTGNILLTLLLLVMCLLISQFAALRDAFTSAVESFVAFLFYLFSLFKPEESVLSGGSGGGSGGDLGMLESADPSLVWIILERIAAVLAAVLLVALLVFFSCKIWTLLKRLANHIRMLFRRYAQSLKTDYVDQTEDLSGWGDVGRTLREKAGRAASRLRPVNWNALDNRARVRAAYAAVLRREKAPDASRTARETLFSSMHTGKSDVHLFCESYERARYSDHPISDAEAENARRAL